MYQLNWSRLARLTFSDEQDFILRKWNQTVKECNLPYNEYKTMRSAVVAHFKHLKELGREPQMA